MALSAIELPPVLAGPIIRRAEPEVVWIWLATSWAVVKCRPWVIKTDWTAKNNGDVVLASPDDWPAKPGVQSRLRNVFQTGFRCVPLGERLFVTLIPLRPRRPFERGRRYGYGMSLTLSMEAGEFTAELCAVSGPTLLPTEAITFHPWVQWPTFRLADGIELLACGSCRRPGATGDDAYPGLEAWISGNVSAPQYAGPAKKPIQALFLLGDQIYADDVAGPLWAAVQELAEHLFGTVELMPRLDYTHEYRYDSQARSIGEIPYTPASQQKDPPILSRRGMVLKVAKFTTDDGEGHLLGFSEYAAHYLLMWSPDLFKLFRVESRKDATGKSDLAHNDKYLSGLVKGVEAAQRIVANFPVYMIFDDHDVTDDWNFDEYWRESTQNTKNPVGRWIVINALAAYWAFQGWGNDPAAFDEDFLTTVQDYATRASNARNPTADQIEETPEFKQCAKLLLNHDGWPYMAPTNPPVVVADTRTQRTPGGKDYADIVLGSKALKRLEDLVAAALSAGGVSQIVLLLSGPVLGWTPMRWGQFQQFDGSRASAYKLDVEQFWNNPRSTGLLFEALVKLVSERTLCIFLSGEVHHSYVSPGKFFALPGNQRFAAVADRIRAADLVEIMKWFESADKLPEYLGVTSKARLNVFQITSSPIKNIHERFHSIKRVGEKNVVVSSGFFLSATLGELHPGVLAVDVYYGNRVWVGVTLPPTLGGTKSPGGATDTAVGLNNFCVVNLGDSRSVEVFYVGSGGGKTYIRSTKVPRASVGVL